MAPLETLWWADDPSVFVSGDRGEWQWRAMIRMPEFVSREGFNAVRDTVALKLTKKGADIEGLNEVRLETLNEGDCLQTLHVGPYSEEAATLAHLHDDLMPANGVSFNGLHHEIYLSDPRRVAPEKLRTILRQPVKALP